MNTTQTIRCFYHSGDWDGIMSGAILRKRFNEDNFVKLNLHPINYGEDFDEKVFKIVGSNDIVYMVDFAMKPIRKMVKLEKQCKGFVWIDHHADTIRMAKEIGFNPIGCRVDGTAACILTWKWFFPTEPVPEGLGLIGKYDVWNLDDERVKPFYAGMELASHSPKSMIAEMLLQNNKDVFDDILKQGEVIRAYQRKQYIESAEHNGFDIDFGDYKAFAINGFVDIDDLIEEGLFDQSKYSFLLMFEKRTDWWKFSMRSRGDDCVDVSAICRRFGGGGHKQASGFETKDNKIITRMIEGKIVITKEQ